MGMDLYTNTNVITSEEFKKFKDGELYIDKYDLTLISEDDSRYDEDIFDCYINYNDWIGRKDPYDGYLNRDWIEVGDSVVLIQSRFD